MTLHIVYSSPTTPGSTGWADDLGDAVLRLGKMDGLIGAAETLTVAVSSLTLDSPSGDIGHLGDNILGLKRVYVTESAAPAGNRYVFNGYVQRRTYRRGAAGERGSLITQLARVVEVELADTNSTANFQVITGADGDRPSETDVARIAWLLGSAYADFIHDNGFVDTTGPVTLDATDYRGSYPYDVLRNCMEASGKNAFIVYMEAYGQDTLHYYKDVSAFYDSGKQFTNVLADIDNATTFGILLTPESSLVRDPTRVYAGGYMAYSGGAVYDTRPQTAWYFAWRDGIAQSSNVKSGATATSLLQRWLAEAAVEEDRLTWTAKMAAADVNAVREGQLCNVFFTHMPGYDADFVPVRVLRRNVAANEETDEFYNITYEAVGIPPPGFHQAVLSSVQNAGSIIPAEGTYTLIWNGAGAGTPPRPADPVVQDTDNYANGVTSNLTELVIPAGLDGTYRVGMSEVVLGTWWPISQTDPLNVPYPNPPGTAGGCGNAVGSGHLEMTLAICRNGVAVVSGTWTSDGGLRFVSPKVGIDGEATFVSGDVVTGTVTYTGAFSFGIIRTAYGNTGPGNDFGVMFLTFLRP